VSIQQIIDGVIEREKGYANNPNDVGGETMWGITIATARRNEYTGAMRDLTRDQAAATSLPPASPALQPSTSASQKSLSTPV
jgi:lysozyme family protein